MRKIILVAALWSAPLALVAPARAQVVPAQNVIPDVSKLEYRSVTLAALGNSRFGSAQPIAGHLWVVPAHDGKPALGIGWDGVPYELQNVGAKANWRADVEAFLQTKNRVWPPPFGFAGRPIARQLLMQLGAADLQRKVGAQIKLYGPNNPRSDYLQNLRDAGFASFAAEQFSQAQLQSRKLLDLRPAGAPAGFQGLSLEARQVIADIERREGDAPRPTDEIAGLIWDLQNVRAYQMSVPGTIIWTQNPTIQKLIDAGDRAVEPLLDALENDDRLTLSFYEARVRSGPGSVGTVRDAAQSALEVILKHRYSVTNYRLPPAERAANIAAQMRADWNKVKGQSPLDRVFNNLSQSGQTPERLLEAARELVRVGAPYNRNFVRLADGTLKPDTLSQLLFGEPLRARHNPSVSDVLEARIIELSRRALSAKPSPNALDPTLPTKIGAPDAYQSNRAMSAANDLAVIYAKWEPKRALPLLGAQLERAKTFVAKSPRGTREAAQNDLNRAQRQFLATRFHSPQRAEAMREYGAFLQAQPFGRIAEENYLPLWRFPDEPAMAQTAHALFDAPRKPFESAATWKTSGFNYDSAFRLLDSPLVKNPSFKAAILRELKNQTVVGTLRIAKEGEAEIKVTAWNWSGQNVYLKGKSLENGASQPMRVCDLVGFHLKQKRPDENGQARNAAALDVTWPMAQRDARLKQIAVLVQQGRVVADSFGIPELEF